MSVAFVVHEPCDSIGSVSVNDIMKTRKLTGWLMKHDAPGEYTTLALVD